MSTILGLTRRSVGTALRWPRCPDPCTDPFVIFERGPWEAAKVSLCLTSPARCLARSWPGTFGMDETATARKHSFHVSRVNIIARRRVDVKSGLHSLGQVGLAERRGWVRWRWIPLAAMVWAEAGSPRWVPRKCTERGDRGLTRLWFLQARGRGRERVRVGGAARGLG